MSTVNSIFVEQEESYMLVHQSVVQQHFILNVLGENRVTCNVVSP